MLRTETIAKVNPIGKPRIYFAARKEDYGYLNSVVSNFFMAGNFAVYYDDEQDSRNTKSEDLLNMNVIVLILTEDLLKAPTDVMTRVFPLAIKNHVPLMILGMSDNVGFLLDDFCEKNHLGNRHVIFPNKKDSDRTFLMKLKDFLNEHAFADQVREKIDGQLDGRIFLSYRKTDKPLASEIISMINQSAACVSYGLWYDEYLTAGENFDDEIQTYIDASDVFLLLLTESMLQKGSYALERELLHAVQEEKTVVILDVIEGPHGLPEEIAQSNPIYVTADELRRLPDLLLELIGKRMRTTKWERANQRYFLGLAYLRGITKNKDENLAVSLICEAASAGHLEACDTMVKICVDHYDVKAAITWQTVLANHYGARFQKEHTLRSLDQYLHQLSILAEYHGMLHDYEKMRESYQLIFDLLCKTSGWDNEPSLLESAVIASDKLGTFAEIALNSAEDKIRQLQLAEHYYRLSFEYANKYAYFERSLKADRYLYTPLMRMTDLDAKWTNSTPAELFERYHDILKMMKETDQKYPSYETLCDLSGCYQTLTQLSEDANPGNTMSLALCWLEHARQAYLTSRNLECCGKYALAMEYVAGLQYASGEITEAIRNLNKATKARTECISGNERSGVDSDADVVALFFDYVNDAKMQMNVKNLENAAICITSAENTLRSYPQILGTQRNVILLENLRKALGAI